jgi:tetratricopeptide (TPR) repeat protein
MKYAVGALRAAADVARSQGEADLRVQALFTTVSAASQGHDLGLTKEILEEMEPLVADDPDRLLGVTAWQAFCFWLLEDMPRTLAKEKEMNDLIRRAPNSPSAGFAGMWVGVFGRWRGNHKKSSEIFERTLPILKASAEPIGYLQSCMLFGLSMGEQGRYQEAIRVLKEGREFGLQSGDRYTTPKVTNSLGWAYHELCLFNQAIETNTLALNSIQALLGAGTSNLFEIESQTRVNLGENYFLRSETRKKLGSTWSSSTRTRRIPSTSSTDCDVRCVDWWHWASFGLRQEIRTERNLSWPN